MNKMELIALAEQQQVMLLEAITNQYYPNYIELKKQLERIGNVHVVSCNYSQYSSRFDALNAGRFCLHSMRIWQAVHSWI